MPNDSGRYGIRVWLLRIGGMCSLSTSLTGSLRAWLQVAGVFAGPGLAVPSALFANRGRFKLFGHAGQIILVGSATARLSLCTPLHWLLSASEYLWLPVKRYAVGGSCSGASVDEARNPWWLSFRAGQRSDAGVHESRSHLEPGRAGPGISHRNGHPAQS